jgi:hypothetical protein
MAYSPIEKSPGESKNPLRSRVVSYLTDPRFVISPFKVCSEGDNGLQNHNSEISAERLFASLRKTNTTVRP